MRFARGRQRRLGRRQPGASALGDPAPFHLGNLSQHGKDQFAHPATDPSKAVNLDKDAPIHKRADRRLDIERIASEAIDGVNANDVTFSNNVQKLRKAWPLSGRYAAADAFILEFTLKRSAKGMALRLDALVG